MTTLTIQPLVIETLDRLVASGRYASPSEALEEAVGLLDAREAAFAEFDDAITRAIASADAGLCVSIDDAEKFLVSRYRSA